MNSQKALILNALLFLVAAGGLFRGVLPALDEIQSQNQQLKQLSQESSGLHAKPLALKATKLYALPEAEQKHWNQEVEQLARQQGVRLIALETHVEQTETFSKWHVKSTPYVFGIQSADPQSLAKFWRALDRMFPELMIQQVHYQKEVATIEARLLTSSDSIRLFTAGN